MTVRNVWNFRNNINKGKNGPEYVRKRRELYKTIQEEYTKGTKGLLKVAHHLIYGYYRKYYSQRSKANNVIGYIQSSKQERTFKVVGPHH